MRLLAAELSTLEERDWLGVQGRQEYGNSDASR